jgi:hypothetical protein
MPSKKAATATSRTHLRFINSLLAPNAWAQLPGRLWWLWSDSWPAPANCSLGSLFTAGKGLAARNSPKRDDTPAFQHLKLSTRDKCIVTNLWLVQKAHGCIGAVAWPHGTVWAINELNAQHFAVAVTHTKMRTVTTWSVLRKPNGRPAAAFLSG